MPEESTFRKYVCPKLKLSKLLLDNLFWILVQNLSALEELNSKIHTPSPTVWFLRNCGISQNSSCRIAQKRNRAILREMTFVNNCANCCFFSRKTDGKERKILRFVPQKLRKSFANGNPMFIARINTYFDILQQ